ncbi:MAG: hypothetical protein GY785_09140 [Gammaproteobacteria bacterium]|nr:hypothetical protein [Gammaproteobacteria bacterium]
MTAMRQFHDFGMRNPTCNATNPLKSTIFIIKPLHGKQRVMDIHDLDFDRQVTAEHATS